jgi:hypothetical protein
MTKSSNYKLCRFLAYALLFYAFICPSAYANTYDTGLKSSTAKPDVIHENKHNKFISSDDNNNQLLNNIITKYPRLKVIVEITFEHLASLQTLQKIDKLGFFSQNFGILGVLGKKQGYFTGRAGNLHNLYKSDLPIKVRPLLQFEMAGIYRVHFKVVDKDYTGTVAFNISSPRDSFGKQLIHLEEQISPPVNYTRRIDTAGNKWIDIDLNVEQGQRELKLDFFFVYNVNMAKLVEHALAMVPINEPLRPIVSKQALNMLQASPKIDSDSFIINSLAYDLFNRNHNSSARSNYLIIKKYIKENLPYDYKKRSKFFGGKMVYTAMEQMYNHPEATLQQGFAACPSVSVLETALLRAGGVPARTAGRWGHFFTELYMPGRGWLSTSVTPTGIPLVRDVDHRHLPFVSWKPEISVQTTKWSGVVKVIK